MLVLPLDRGTSNVPAVTRVQCSVFTTSQSVNLHINFLSYKSKNIFLCKNVLRIR